MIEEHGALVITSQQTGAGFADVFLHRGDRRLVYRDDALLVSLAEAADVTAAGVYVFQVQRDQLADPHAARVEQLKHRRVSCRLRCGLLGRLLQQSAYLAH